MCKVQSIFIFMCNFGEDETMLSVFFSLCGVFMEFSRPLSSCPRLEALFWEGSESMYEK